MMGNFFDDSLQVASSLRRFQIRSAFEETLAWSKISRLPFPSSSLACSSSSSPAVLDARRDLFSQRRFLHSEECRDISCVWC
jgi:hypothetical protein